VPFRVVQIPEDGEDLVLTEGELGRVYFGLASAYMIDSARMAD
jgi:hypothetical protein